MNHWTNLLPVKNQVLFECRRQVKNWSIVWLAFLLVWIAVYRVLDRQQSQLTSSIEIAEMGVAPIRQAEIALIGLKNESENLHRRALTADSLQQTDAPLALLQAVGGSCQDFGNKVQIDSLRMDEISSSEAGKLRLPSKQILLVGSADADYLITAFVNRLGECGVFRKVELESSHALADKLSAKRSFQIRCQQ